MLNLQQRRQQQQQLNLQQQRQQQQQQKKKKQQQPPPLYDNIILEILSWLQVNAIFRFQCVSKSWLRMIICCIQNPKFIETHLQHSIKTNNHDLEMMFYSSCNGTLCPLQLTYSPRGLVDDITITTKAGDCGIIDGIQTFDSGLYHDQAKVELEIHACCNGLILISICDVLCLWNPCTHEIKEVPEPPEVDVFRESRRCNDIDNTLESVPYYHDQGVSYDARVIKKLTTIVSLTTKLPLTTKLQAMAKFVGAPKAYVYELIYDDILRDYKIIIYVPIVKYPGNCRFYTDIEVLVYTLGTNLWRRIPDPCKRIPPTSHQFIDLQEPLFLNGSHYWLTYNHDDKPLSVSILAFDIAREEFWEVPVRHILEKRVWQLKLCSIRGSLCIYHNGNKHLNVWAMKVYGVEDSWTKLISTAQPELADEAGHLKLLWSFENGSILIQKNTDFFLFDPQRNEAKLLEYAKPSFEKSWRCTQLFIRSFVSLNSNTYLRIKYRGKQEKKE